MKHLEPGQKGQEEEEEPVGRSSYGRLRAAASSGQAHREGAGETSTPTSPSFHPLVPIGKLKAKGVLGSCSCRSASRSTEQGEEGWRANLEEQMEAT